MDTEQLLSEFQANPSSFDELSAAADTAPVNMYKALRDRAKRTLSSFDAYLQFYADMLEHGPEEQVREDLERNAVRSLKNMVTGGSRSGRQFPINTASEFRRRVDEYASLGVDTVTERSAALTLLEHLYDDSDRDHTDIYRLLDSLLSQTPSERSTLVEFLARAKFTTAGVASLSESGLDEAIDRFRTTLPEPLPEDDRDPERLLEAADDLPWRADERIELVQTAFVRTGHQEALERYLYSISRDTVERGRHGDEQARPWRGELQLTRRELQTHQTLFPSPTEERVRRRDCYLELTYGMIQTGGRWRSHRDSRSLPDADFAAGARGWLQAAAHIQPVDKRRYLKHLSKGYRFISTAAGQAGLGRYDGWEYQALINRSAIEILAKEAEALENEQLKDSSESEADEQSDGENLTILVNQLTATHLFERFTAEAAVAFFEGDAETIHQALDRATDQFDQAEIRLRLERVERLRELARGIEAEAEGQYETALEIYQGGSHRGIVSSERIELTRVKQTLQRGDREAALERAEDAFGAESPIVAGVSALTDNSPKNVSVTGFEQMDPVPRSTEDASSLVTMTTVAGCDPEPLSTELERRIEGALLFL